MDAPANADLAVATRTPGTVPIPLLFVTLGAALTGILILSRAPFGASVAAATMIAVNICAFGWIWTTLLARQVDLAEFIGVGVGGAFIGPTVGYLIFSLVSPPLPSLGLAWCLVGWPWCGIDGMASAPRAADSIAAPSTNSLDACRRYSGRLWSSCTDAMAV